MKNVLLHTEKEREREVRAKQANTGLECILAKHVGLQALSMGPHIVD